MKYGKNRIVKKIILLSFDNVFYIKFQIHSLNTRESTCYVSGQPIRKRGVIILPPNNIAALT